MAKPDRAHKWGGVQFLAGMSFLLKGQLKLSLAGPPRPRRAGCYLKRVNFPLFKKTGKGRGGAYFQASPDICGEKTLAASATQN